MFSQEKFFYLSPGQRQRQREEQCERSHNSDRVDDDSTRRELHQSNLENHPRWHLGPSCPHGWGCRRWIRNWIHLGSDPTQRNIHTVQILACCTRFGGQLRRWACVLSARLRVDRHWAKQESSLGIGERTQTETLRWASSSDETSRWTQNLDHISSMWSQRTHHDCGQVLCQGERSMRHVLDTWWCLVARGGWRDCGR